MSDTTEELEDPNIDESAEQNEFEDAFVNDDFVKKEDDKEDDADKSKDEDSDDDDQEDDDDEESDDDDQEELNKRAKEKEDEDKEDDEEEEDDQEDDDQEPSEPVSIESIVTGLGEEKATAINEMFDDFPEIKDLMGAILENLDPQKQAEQKQSEEKKAEKQEELEHSRFWAKLIIDNPDAQEVAKSDGFHKWLSNQNQGIQSMANSLNTDDASLVLKAYGSFEKNAKAKKAKAKATREKKNNLHATTLKGGGGQKSKSKQGDDSFESAFYEED